MEKELKKMGFCLGFIVVIIGVVVLFSIFGVPTSTKADGFFKKNEPKILAPVEAVYQSNSCGSFWDAFSLAENKRCR